MASDTRRCVVCGGFSWIEVVQHDAAFAMCQSHALAALDAMRDRGASCLTRRDLKSSNPKAEPKEIPVCPHGEVSVAACDVCSCARLAPCAKSVDGEGHEAHEHCPDGRQAAWCLGYTLAGPRCESISVAGSEESRCVYAKGHEGKHQNQRGFWWVVEESAAREHAWDAKGRCFACGIYRQYVRDPENRYCPTDIAPRASHATPEAAPQVPPAAQALTCERRGQGPCEGDVAFWPMTAGVRKLCAAHAIVVTEEDVKANAKCAACSGNGYVWQDVGDVPGHATMVPCLACGPKCGATSKAGHRCFMKRGHGIHHVAPDRFKWSGDERDAPALRGWRFLDASGEWGGIVQLKDAPDYPKTASHLCRGTPPMIEADVGYAVQCPRDGWIDVTDVVVRNFVVAWEPHDLLPNGESAGEAGLLAKLLDMLEPMVARIVKGAVEDQKRAEVLRAAADVALEHIKEQGRS